MEFRILGPLEAADGAHVIALGGPKQRALLALLLLNANEVVASERLLEELWPEQLPASGVTALQVRVSQLRRVLEQAGPSILLTKPPGYLLRVEAGALDADRFEYLLDEGRSALARGDPAGASTTLRTALGLWRGSALADFTGELFARSEAARLEELRLAALEIRIESELALGRHADVVAELEALVSEHPLREGLRGRLMLSLYRSGRQADALATYRNGRRLLSETLGLEPSDELRRLEAAMLRQDAALAAPAIESPSPVVDEPPGERKLVTILFADVVGSTELVASQDPELARAQLDRLFDAVGAEIDAAGGTVEKFIGDAVLAVFGAPVAQEDHPERALHTALAIVRRVAELFGSSLSIGVGVATGEVVVGRAHRGGTFVTGPVVNLSARLEQAASAGEILVHARSAAAARGAFEFGAPRTVDAKGFPDAIVCRPLTRALALTRPKGVGALAPSFVGRHSELDLLHATYRRVAGEARPSLVTILGDAGVGKSSLVHAFWELLAREEPEPTRRSGSCLSYGRGITYRPLADVLREELGLLSTDQPEVIFERLRGREILARLLGFDVEPDLHPLVARDELYRAFAGFLEELVDERPAVILLEDIHWAEDPLLEIVERLLKEMSGALLVVATARPELLATRPTWAAGLRDASTLWLDPLSLADTELLIEELTAGALPAALSALLVARSEGNPFYAEELLGGLIDRGLVARTAGGWTASELPDDLVVPDSLRGVLASRIDLLQPAEKAALQAASVIGRTFWRGALRALTEDTPFDLAALEQRDFIRRRSASSIVDEREFVFKHALTREVAYSAVPKARRARMHATFADWLERVGAGRDDHASLLAHHYAEASRPEDTAIAWTDDDAGQDRVRERALHWLRRAAQLAIGRYEIDDGLVFLERALEREPIAAARCGIWREIGRANGLKFDGEAFWNAMVTAAELAPDAPTRADICSELAVQAFVRAGMWVTHPGVELVEEWIAQALEFAAPRTPARARARIAQAFHDLDNERAAIEAVEIAEQLDDPELRVHAWDARGAVAMAAGDYETAWRWRTRRLELLDKVSDPDLRTIIGETPFPACIASCRFEEARAIARLHDELTAPLTPHHRMHGVAILVEVEELLGGWSAIDALEQRVREAVAANAETPCLRNARSLLVCALAAAAAGDARRAADLERAADRLGLRGEQVLAAPKLRLALARGDRTRAKELLARLLADDGWYARGHGTMLATRVTRLDALVELGEPAHAEREATALLQPGTYLEPFALRALGRARSDRELIQRSVARFDALGLGWHAAETRALL